MKAEKDLLEKIKNMSKEELDVLCEDIRKTIIDTVSRNGGHLASNLGIVEATVSLYRNFDFPKDSLIFDVGHQSYPHKILSGRGEEFETLRKFGGISGFTDRFESEFDKVNAGHCGPSVSAAIGVATANKLSNSDSYTVCVVGDGSFTNGMIYEALNNCLDKSLKLIIVLNDNEMSISKNVGAMSDYFSKIRTSKRYFSLKHFFYSAFSAIPLVGKHLVGFARGFKDFLKRVVVKSNFFEDFGIDYLGPVDGNDIKKLDIVFKEAKAKNSICLVHICTKKGKGYPYSQESPEQYHSVGTFDVSCGSAPSGKGFSNRFGDALCAIAEKDDRVCAVTAAMTSGVGLEDFKEKFPDRFFDVGIAEEHAVTFCSGLSISGMKVVCALYSTFSQRVYDQLIHDVALQKTPFVLALDRCGIVPGDGVTHQGVFDYSMLSSIPGCKIYSPETASELSEILNLALRDNCLTAIRYPKGKEETYDRSSFVYSEDKSFSVSKDVRSDDKKSRKKAVIITSSRMTHTAFTVREMLKANVLTDIVKLIKTYPVPSEDIYPYCKDADLIYVLDENIKSGGLGEKITAQFVNVSKSGNERLPRIFVRAVENTFVPCGDLVSLFRLCKFDKESVASEIEELLK